jgi:hypothetical protein
MWSAVTSVARSWYDLPIGSVRQAEGGMGALVGDVFGLCVLGFLAVAGLSLMTAKTPATPPFARRAPTSSTPQLRQDANAGFLSDRGFLFRRRVWFVATCCPPVRIEDSRYNQLAAGLGQQPVAVVRSGPRTWWWFENAFYWESGGYQQRDVLALIRDRQRRAAKHLDRARTLLNVEEGRQERPLDLQYDHVIPVALGGATSLENLQLLCGDCNRAKGANP